MFGDVFSLSKFSQPERISSVKMNQHRLYIWPLNVEPTYNLKATFSTKESMLRWLDFRESVWYSILLGPSFFWYDTNCSLVFWCISDRASHTCMICSKQYKDSSSFQRHLLAHTGDRPHLCTHVKCNKAFKSKKELKLHMTIHSGKYAAKFQQPAH